MIMSWPFCSVASHCPCNQMLQLSHWLHCPSVSLLWGSPVPCPSLQLHVVFPSTFWFRQVILVHPLDIICLPFPEPTEVPTFSVQLKAFADGDEKTKNISLSLVRSESAWAQSLKSWKNWKNGANEEKIVRLLQFPYKWSQSVLAALRSTKLAPS